MIELTQNQRDALKQITLTPTMLFKISGYDKVFGSAEISELIHIGDPDLYIGNDWVIGGVRAIQGQNPYLSFTAGGGTSSTISQKIAPDRKESTSVSSMVVSLIDNNEEISQLISPGFDLEDILGRECEIWIGFAGTAYPQDYNIVFRGLITDIESGAGYVNFTLLSSEDKKRRPLIVKKTSELNGTLLIGDTTINVVDGSIFTNKVLGPDGNYDIAIERLGLIEDEIVMYNSVSSNQLLSVTRGYIGTAAAAHDDEQEIIPGIYLQGNGITLALKIMLSGWNDYYAEDIEITSINYISAVDLLDGAVYFDKVNVERIYGITVGDFMTITGTTGGLNDITLLPISAIQVTEDGSYVIIDAATFVDELDTPGTASFRSKYDTLGIGLKMKPSEVDVAQHEFIRDNFLAVFDMAFALFDVSVTKEFIDKDIYLPMACIGVPRSGRSSVTYTIGPIGANSIPTLDINNVKNAPSLKVKRSTANNFINEINFQYDYDSINNKFKTSKVFDSETSQERINTVGLKVMTIQSQGIKTNLQAGIITRNSADRMLARYQYGAEFITNVQLLFEVGYSIEIGDVVLMDYASLKLTDFNTGDRDGGLKYLEVMNKSLNNKTGDVTVDLVNTAFEVTDRYGSIGPASKVDAGATTTKLPIKMSFGTTIYQNETYKWIDRIGETILVHTPDWTSFAETTIKSVITAPPTIICDPALSFTPVADDIVDMPSYPTSTDTQEEIVWKSNHAFLSPNVDVAASASQTQVEVDPSDIAKFLVGAVIRINNFTYSDYSPEAVVTAVDTILNLVDFDTASGFTINNTHEIKFIGFADGGYSYRYI